MKGELMIEETIKAFAQQDNFGTITTLMRDGMPSTHVMWVDADDEHVLINTEVHRAKYRNLKRDPRATVTVWDKNNPYRYVEVRGRVVDTVHGESARRHIDELSVKYKGRPYDASAIKSERVILKIAPERQRTYL
jgi:PPOX class probable F420-dependent enzyme